jgi:hypothetical protein
MPRDEYKDIEGVDQVGAALGEIFDPRLSKIASSQMSVCRSQAVREHERSLTCPARWPRGLHKFRFSPTPGLAG